MQFLAWGEMERREKEIRKLEAQREKERHLISDNIWTSGDRKRRYIGIGNERKKERENKKLRRTVHAIA